MDLANLLTGLFGVDPKKASDISAKLTEEEFYERVQRLESLIGEKNAPGVVKEGEFLSYRGQTLDEYFELASRARAVMAQVVPVPVFYSIESLRGFLGYDEEKKVEIDVSKLNLFEYRLLQPDNMGRNFLEALCSKGHVTVRSYDYWSNGKRPKGRRGGDIIEEIRRELFLMFNNLGLGNPEYRLSRGEKSPTITISDETRETLKEIKDKVYGQRK